MPLILRGPAPILTWTPPNFRPAGSDTLQRLMALYGETDPKLAQVLAAGIGVDKLAAGDDLMMGQGGAKAPPGHGVEAAFAALAAGAGRLLADEAGPRLAAISYDGWDTHASEGADKGRLATLLGALDGAMAALRDSMKPVWKDTAVVLMTEFGRTAHINGTEGTDHGTATTAFLLGGAVQWRPRRRRLAGPEAAAALPAARPRADDGPACRAEGRAARPSRRVGERPGEDRVPGQHRGEAARRPHRLTEGVRRGPPNRDRRHRRQIRVASSGRRSQRV